MRTFGSVSFVVYKEYFKAGGNCFVIFIMGVMFLLAQLCASIGDYAIAQWYVLFEFIFQHIAINVPLKIVCRFVIQYFIVFQG